MQIKQQNQGPRIFSPGHNTTLHILPVLQSSKCNKCNKMHSSTLFANRCPRIHYPRRNNTLHILPVLQSSQCNKMQRSKVFANQGPRILYPQHNTFFLQSTFFHSRWIIRMHSKLIFIGGLSDKLTNRSLFPPSNHLTKGRTREGKRGLRQIMVM